jgi:hypothetical protein
MINFKIFIFFYFFSRKYLKVMLTSTDKVFRYGRNLKSRIKLLFTYDKIKILS